MKIDKNAVMIIVSGLVVLIGIGVLLSSTGWGQSAANAYLGNQAGGSMGTSTFLTLMREYIASCRKLGTVILGAGLVGLLVGARRLMN